MKCDDMPQKLISLLYDELDEKEAAKIHAHLKTCTACRQVYEELGSTSKLLQKWEDVTPGMNFIFTQEPTSRWEVLKEKIHRLSWKRRLALGIPALAAVSLLFLAILNFRVSYQEGDWQVAFSIVPPREETNQQEQFAQAITQVQNETLLLIAKMIEESEYRQRREFSLTLAEFAQQQEKQRRQDLRMLGRGLEGLQLTTEGRLNQTNAVLNDLIRLTSYKLERE